MPNDAKLGLVVGVAIVLVMGLVYFRGDASPSGPGPARVTATRSSQYSPVIAPSPVAIRN